MAPKPHTYTADLEWTGAANGPTVDYKSYSREFTLRLPGKIDLRGSSDPNFVGDPSLHNPEDLLLAALSSCHMLTWLSLCARRGVRVSAYRDAPEATMTWIGDTYAFTSVVMRPRCTVAIGTDPALVQALHDESHKLCFIARSVNFPVICEPATLMA